MAPLAAVWLRLGAVFVLVWQLIRWPVIVSCAIMGVDLVHHFAPNRAAPWMWMTPGALTATGLWIASSLGFTFYISNFADYTATCGAIVTMLWFYVSGLAILIEAELNSIMEDAWRSS